MLRSATKIETDEPHAAAYSGDIEYLSDELRRLDLLIRMKIGRQSKPPAPLDQFQGLVISEEEINSLLNSHSPLEPERQLRTADPDQRNLIEALTRLEDDIARRRKASLDSGVFLSLPRLSQLFHLTPFDEGCLVVCLAPELDRKYEKLFAYLHDDVTRKKPSVDLLLSLLCETAEEKVTARLDFDPAAPLMKHRLLLITDSSPEGSLPLLSRSLKLDDRIANFLLGFNRIDGRLEAMALVIPPSDQREYPGLDEETAGRAVKLVRMHLNDKNGAGRNMVFNLSGAYGSGAHLLARAVCNDIGIPLVVGDAGKLVAGPLGFEEAIRLLGRESLLQPAALCLENFDVLLTDDDKHHSGLRAVAEITRTFSRLTFLTGSRPWIPHEMLGDQVFVGLEFPLPGDGAREALWKSHVGQDRRLGPDVDFGILASKFRLTSGQIVDAVNRARSIAAWRSPEEGRITMEDLHTACRAQSSPKLGRLARKITPKYQWSDIVLPEDQASQIREISDQARLRHVVYGEWGFGRKLSLGKGLNVLFSGPPGTGKTMAAEVIANELQLDLFKIDLSQVVSKYIGETEKNLHNIFHEAQASGAILFFDEADALFGKRSEVKDAHDRYANIEIGYLLQKMEEYDGIAILATNLRQNLDEAFVRRMHFIVEFPFPDEEYRRRIWQVIFPCEAPLGDDVDFGLLARDVRLAGGNIKNIALAAAFFAASDGKVIRTPHLIRAARREHQKLGRTWNEVERSRQETPVS